MAEFGITKIYLVRHGYTGIDEFEQKRADGLSKVGVAQAKCVAKRIHKETHLVHRIYTSSLERAVETAGIIAGQCKSTIRIDPRLNEIDAIANPLVLAELKRHKTAFGKQHKLLSLSQERAVSFLRELAIRHNNETIVLVSHGNIIRGIIAEAVDASIETVAHLIVANASVSILEYEHANDYFRLTLFNDTSHCQK